LNQEIVNLLIENFVKYIRVGRLPAAGRLASLPVPMHREWRSISKNGRVFWKFVFFALSKSRKSVKFFI